MIRITRNTRNMIANAISSTEFMLASREASFQNEEAVIQFLIKGSRELLQ